MENILRKCSIYSGDIFDEGKWCNATEFEYYIRRFHSLFYVPKNTHLYVVAGNHDMGFHYGMMKNILSGIHLNKRGIDLNNIVSNN